jgi:hypothetical protein
LAIASVADKDARSRPAAERLQGATEGSPVWHRSLGSRPRRAGDTSRDRATGNNVERSDLEQVILDGVARSAHSLFDRLFKNSGSFVISSAVH